jgi:hypothetical protein
MKTNVLDMSHTVTVTNTLLDVLDETGYSDPREAIPGLVGAIVAIAAGDDTLLDAAANLLADGGV